MSNDLSGYHDCPCRDCFEIAIGTEEDGSPSLCNDCAEAGCDPEGCAECEAEGAYGGDDEGCEHEAKGTASPGCCGACPA